jgi:hypothetical protein
VRDNGFKDDITIIHGAIEEVELPVDKVGASGASFNGLSA